MHLCNLEKLSLLISKESDSIHQLLTFKNIQSTLKASKWMLEQAGNGIIELHSTHTVF